MFLNSIIKYIHHIVFSIICIFFFLYGFRSNFVHLIVDFFQLFYSLFCVFSIHFHCLIKGSLVHLLAQVQVWRWGYHLQSGVIRLWKLNSVKMTSPASLFKLCSRHVSAQKEKKKSLKMNRLSFKFYKQTKTRFLWNNRPLTH